MKRPYVYRTGDISGPEKTFVDWIRGDLAMLRHLSAIAVNRGCDCCPELPDCQFVYGDEELGSILHDYATNRRGAGTLYVELAGGDPKRLPLLRDSLPPGWEDDVRWDVVRDEILHS